MILTVLRQIFMKLSEVLLSLILLSAFSFALVRFLPGGPFDDELQLNSVVKQNLTQQWGLNQSLGEQWVKYLQAVAKGDLSFSMVHPEIKVTQLISQAASISFNLAAVTFLVILITAFTLAILTIYYRGTFFEAWMDQLMIIMLSLPSLFWGPILIYLFGFYFNLLPVAFLTGPSHYVLPVLTLGLRPMAVLVRMLKNSMKENLQFDYVRTARAKGMGEFRILIKQVLRNSLIPLLGYMGSLVSNLVSGSFLVELLFAIQGLGLLFINSINDRDYTLTMGLVLFYGFTLIIVNLLVDVLLFAADPRMRQKP